MISAFSALFHLHFQLAGAAVCLFGVFTVQRKRTSFFRNGDTSIFTRWSLPAIYLRSDEMGDQKIRNELGVAWDCISSSLSLPMIFFLLSFHFSKLGLVFHFPHGLDMMHLGALLKQLYLAFPFYCTYSMRLCFRDWGFGSCLRMQGRV